MSKFIRKSSDWIFHKPTEFTSLGLCCHGNDRNLTFKSYIQPNKHNVIIILSVPNLSFIPSWNTFFQCRVTIHNLMNCVQPP